MRFYMFGQGLYPCPQKGRGFNPRPSNRMVRSWKIADLVVIFASLDVIMPDVDR